LSEILKPSGPIQPWGEASAYFIHNWRCAGSTLNSLLASNFTDDYLKVGMAFSQFGWPDSSSPELTTLADLRKRFKPGCIIGGHLFAGLEAFLPGPWQIWMNAREPMSRLRSGILRFHASGLAHIRAKDLMEHTGGLETPEDVATILAGPLKREGNGLCRRLAGLSACQDLDLDAQSSNLERIPLLESAIPEAQLLKLGRANLPRIKVLILCEYLHASVLCLETIYGLRPLINPFSDLRHNPVQLGKPQASHKALLKQCSAKLEEHVRADLQLWPHLKAHFQLQLEKTKISKQDIKIRELIHAKPLIDPRWMVQPTDTVALVKGWSARIAERALVEPELGERLINTVCSWHRLEDDAAEKIHHYSHKIFRSKR
jgi:hypothetical protein